MSYVRKGVVFSILWFTAAMSYYGITLTKHSENVYIGSFLVALIGIPGQIGSAAFVRLLTRYNPLYYLRRARQQQQEYQEVGDHPQQTSSSLAQQYRVQSRSDIDGVWLGVVMSTLISGLLFILLFVLQSQMLQSSGGMRWLITVISLIAHFFVSLEFTLCYTLTGAAFHTSIRGRAVGLCVMVARFGAILSPFITQYKLPGDSDAPSDGLSTLACIVLGACSIASSVGLLFIRNDVHCNDFDQQSR
ncbi:hypothetical protein MP228_006767 [Amoeboaphelidium protococcarum]|nr:hypothetical protein MP228_006767 [Amoeboaphelidium protococcarum]